MDSWTAADTAAVSGVVADLLGTLASFVPGKGNVIGAGLNLAGTALQTTARAKNEGFSWGLVGSTAANIGFDFLGLMPVIGSAANAARVMRSLRKLSSYQVQGLMSLAGGGVAGNVIWRMFTGELNVRDMTTDDM